MNKYSKKSLFTVPIMNVLINGEATVNTVAESAWPVVSKHMTYNDVNTVLSGEPAWRNRLRWNLAELKQKNLVKSPKRGVYSITDYGKDILNLFCGV